MKNSVKKTLNSEKNVSHLTHLETQTRVQESVLNVIKPVEVRRVLTQIKTTSMCFNFYIRLFTFNVCNFHIRKVTDLPFMHIRRWMGIMRTKWMEMGVVALEPVPTECHQNAICLQQKKC